jgi:hypothetical protein
VLKLPWSRSRTSERDRHGALLANKITFLLDALLGVVAPGRVSALLP